MKQQVIFTFHGIHGSADNFGDILRDWTDVHARAYVVEDIFWGRITGLQMYAAALIPFWMRGRRAEAARLMREDRSLRGNPNSHVVAHSYGTQFVVDLLWANRDLKVDGLILVGSVLEERFYRTRLPQLVDRGQVQRVLNVWSPNDSIIRHWSCGPFGQAGATGFVDLTGSEPVWQDKTEEEHATYFWSEFRGVHFARWVGWLEGARLL